MRVGDRITDITLQNPEAVFEEIWAAVKQEKLAAGQPRSGSSMRALEFGRLALSVAESTGELRWQTEACSVMAYVLNANESYTDSLPYYERAIENLEALGRHAQAARVRLGYVYALLMTGHVQDALRVGRIADAWFLENGDKSGHAKVQMNLGTVYKRLDDHSTAYECYLEAAAFFQQEGDLKALSQVYLNLANVLSSLGRLEESDLMYERVDALCEQLGLTNLLLQTRYNRAYLAFLRGRYSQALRGFNEVRPLFKEHKSERHSALCDLDEAEIYLQLNSPANAASVASRAVEKFRDLNMQYELAKATAFLGLSLCQNRLFGEALDVFRTSRSIFHDEGNSYWASIVDLYIAEVIFSLGRIWESRPLALKAMEHFHQLNAPFPKAKSLVLLGRIALQMGKVTQAQDYADQLLAITREKNIFPLLFPAYALCGQIAERARSLDRAREFYELAAQELETHRMQILHDELHGTFFQSKQQVYQALVRLDLNDRPAGTVVESVFKWIESSKSRSLRDLLGNELVSGDWNRDEGLLNRVTRLREELNSHYLRMRPEAENSLASISCGFVQDKELELARNLRELSHLDPEYGSLHNASTVSLKDFQGALDSATTVVEYFIAREEVLAQVITGTGSIIVRHVCPAGRLRYLCEKFETQIQKFDLTPQYARTHEEKLITAFNDELTNIYTQLFAPVRPFVLTRKLLIVPHGTLHLLPFHLFRNESGYLFEQFDITYAPSGSIATYNLSKPVVEGEPLIVNTLPENSPESVAKTRNMPARFRLLEHDRATRERFVQEAAVASFLIIHAEFTFRQENPMLSGFRLADGWITAMELHSMNCQSNAVALDGIRKIHRHNGLAEDLLSLARGFLYSGARSVLLPLWQLPDGLAGDLFAGFHKHTESGKTRPDALKLAINEIRSIHPHPYFWGPFLLFGN
jgi:tetratricopeptide (TPR) repeat protein/CHAT domain-containing protein